MSISLRVSNPGVVYHAPKTQKIAFKGEVFFAAFKVTKGAIWARRDLAHVHATTPAIGHVHATAAPIGHLHKTAAPIGVFDAPAAAIVG